MDDDRIISLHGVHNLRDYGGYAVAGGGRVKRGLLWRSGQHGDAAEADLTAVDALGIATVIDLRGISEREAKPCLRGPGFAGEVLVHEGETAGLALHVEAADGVLSVADARRAMTALYAGIASRERLLPMIARYFDALANRAMPSLVHCVAGKDRTGFAVALFHRAVGVHPDDVMAEYMLTNVAGNIERRIADGAAQIRARHGAIEDETIRTLMGVEPGYLAAAMDAVDAHPGGFDGYLAEVLGVDGAMHERLRERYVD